MLILETERLLLRRLEPRDLDDLYSLYRDPEIRRFFPEGVLDKEQTFEELEWHMNGHPLDSRLGLWAAIMKSNGQFVGRAGLLPWTIRGVDEIEIAYMIAKSHWRQGLGSEVAQALVRYGLQDLGIPSLIALIDPAHVASIRTAERAGLRFDFATEMEGLPTQVYRITANYSS